MGLLTSGDVQFSRNSISFSISGPGFSANGWDDTYASNCGGCPNPFTLVQPAESFPSGNGFITVGEITYLSRQQWFSTPQVPWGFARVYISPLVQLPLITETGTYTVPYGVELFYCVNPAGKYEPQCASYIGHATAEYIVRSGYQGTLIQDFPKFTIHTPELSTGSMLIAFLLAMVVVRLIGKFLRREK